MAHVFLQLRHLHAAREPGRPRTRALGATRVEVALLAVVPTTGTSGPVIWDLEWDQRESQDKGGFWAPMCPWTWVLISGRSCANAQSSLPITVWILKQQLRALEKNGHMLPY